MGKKIANLKQKLAKYEKLLQTYAQAMGGYDALSSGGSPAEMLQVFTGKEATSGKIEAGKKEEILAIFKQALADKKALTLGSLKYLGENRGRDNRTRTPSNQIVVYDHNYFLDKIHEETLHINNPKGVDHLVMEWDEFTQYFVKYFKVK